MPVKKSSKWKQILYFSAIFALVASASFALGRLSAIMDERESVRIEHDVLNIPISEGEDIYDFSQEIEISEGSVVGSVNSDVYHLPWCSGAKRISDDNLIIFTSSEEARKSGYRPAGNCPGL